MRLGASVTNPGVKRAILAGLLVLGVFMLAALISSRSAGASHAGGMDAMSIDMDIAGNTGTSLGPLDTCIEVSADGSVVLDVTAEGIPASNPMIGFSFELSFPANVATVVSADPEFLLASAPGSSVFDVNDPVPDSDGTWNSAAADVGVGLGPDSGSGVLARVELLIDTDADTPNVWPLTLNFNAHIDPANAALIPDVTRSALLAVGTSCQATQTPVPVTPGTATPTQTIPLCACAEPTPTPAILPDTGGVSSDTEDARAVALVGIGATAVLAAISAAIALRRTRGPS
jgi:hypothetical protein